MVKLIRKSDSEIVSGAEFEENAAFFKDTLAFYDAYSKLSERSKQELPNFCFSSENKKLLDGMCLLIKELAAEFPFSSLHLTTDYLKIIYYYIAGMSSTGELPERRVLEERFTEYYKHVEQEYYTTGNVTQDSEGSISTKENLDKINEDILKEKKEFAKTVKICVPLMILFLIGAVASLDLTFLSSLSIPKFVLYILFAVCLGIFVSIIVVLILKNKKVGELIKSNETQRKKLIHQIDSENQAIASKKLETNKIVSEFYDSKSSFETDLMNVFETKLKEQLALIAENKILSYNLKHDIKVFEDKFDKEIFEEVARLNEKDCDFEAEYKNICSKPHLYGSKLVRLTLINEFLSRPDHAWSLPGDQNPFGINLKKLYSDSVSYVAENRQIYTMPAEYIFDSSVRRNLAISKEIKTAEDLYEVKSIAAKHFLDYQKIKGEAGEKTFYKENKPLSEEEIGKIVGYSKIPMILEIKQKLANYQLNLENSKHKNIEVIMKEIVKNENEVPSEEDDEIIPELIIDEFNYVPFEDELDKIINIDEISAKCVYGDKDIIGYKVD